MLRRAFLALSTSKSLGGFMTHSRVAWLGARRFVAGQTIDEAIEVVQQLNQSGMRVTLDYLGENVSTRREAEATAQAYVDAIDRIRAAGVDSGVSLKLTAMGLDLGDAVATEMLERVVAHAAAMDPPVFVRIDMEGSDYTQRTLDIFHALRQRYGNLGIVVQAYLYRTAADVDALVAVGSGPRLCKGAYLEPEAIAWPEKADVDGNYLRLAEQLFDDEARAKGVYPAIASHDPNMIDWVVRHTAERGIGKDAFEFQMLYGVRRDLQQALVDRGYRMRVYVPYGGQWYPYFMRRLAERPENLAFILRNVVEELKPAKK
jgi:proline dehydrogenase